MFHFQPISTLTKEEQSTGRRQDSQTDFNKQSLTVQLLWAMNWSSFTIRFPTEA